MPRGLPRKTLCWVSKEALSISLVKGRVQCPALDVEHRAACDASLLHLFLPPLYPLLFLIIYLYPIQVNQFIQIFIGQWQIRFNLLGQ